MTRILALAIVATSLVAGVASPAAAQAASDKYDDAFRMYAKRFFGPAFDWRLFKAQSIAESGLDPNAKSWVGARGLMQLMPATYKEVQSKNPEIGEIDDPIWNIAAGIYYDSRLWRQWSLHEGVDRRRFMFGSYNAGRGTLLRAQGVARDRAMDPQLWPTIETVAPEVPRWRHEETLDYVRKIEGNLDRMTDKGRIVR